MGLGSYGLSPLKLGAKLNVVSPNMVSESYLCLLCYVCLSVDLSLSQPSSLHTKLWASQSHMERQTKNKAQ